MTKLLRLAVFLALLASAMLANAQPLWGGTEFGMSVGQVKTIVSAATTPGTSGRLQDGAEELLILENVEIVNKKFTASFFFITGKLTQVTLSLERGHTFQGAVLVINSLTEPLRAKYGQEINRDINREVKRDALNRASATWIAGRTNINVIAISWGENDAALNINYQVRIAREADKL